MTDSTTYKVSGYTPLKQYSLKWMLWWHMDIVKTIWKKYPYQKDDGKVKRPYRYFDLHGGHGIDPQGNPGSPLIFHSVANEHQIPYEAFICEKDSNAYSDLAKNVQGFKKFRLFNKDHSFLIKEYRKKTTSEEKHRREYQYGVVYSDPSNANPSFDVLKSVTQAYPRVDIVINLAAASYKRNYSDLKNELLAIKKIWIVRKPVGTHQWTMMLGSNWLEFPQWGEKGFIRFDEPVGQHWFEKIAYTKQEIHQQNNRRLFDFDVEPIYKKKVSEYNTYQEYLAHPKFLAIRQDAMRKAKWFCQVCKSAKATEVHHIKYPPWGEFDVIENLLPICHQCHCQIHNKDD